MTFFADLCQRAAAANLPFLLIGGNAVIAYGYPRQTQDFDLLVHENHRRRWDELITSLGYTQHQVARVFHMYNPINRGLPPVDLMLVNEQTFTKLSAQAVEIEVQDARARIPSLCHLIALKLHALSGGGEHRHGRDLMDVLELVRINRIDLATPQYQEILDRYAKPAIRAELAQHLAGPGPARV